MLGLGPLEYSHTKANTSKKSYFFLDLIKQLAFALLSALLSPTAIMAQVCDPDKPKRTHVGQCDDTDDGLCIVDGQQHGCVANGYSQGGDVR